MDTYMLHHIVRLITTQPEYAVREEDRRSKHRSHLSLDERLTAIWRALAPTGAVERAAYVYCTSHPWDC